MSASHLEYVDSIPEDCIKVDSYRNHTFENLFYSPSANEFYQIPKVRYRRIASDKPTVRCWSDDRKSVKVSIKKLKRQLGITE